MSTSVAEQTALAPAPRTLSDQLADRGVTPAQYHVLTKSLYPGAKPESALMVLDYCAARKLDPMKKPCHIVPMKVKVGDDYEWRDVVLPGIYEYRTTAMRTGLYMGHTAPVYGEIKEYAGVMAPEWCSMTFKRRAAHGDVVIEFPVTVYFREVCNTKDEWIDKKKTGRVIANDRWSKAPIQMLTKTCEAAGLREAFPDEFGGEATFEEMGGGDPLKVEHLLLAQEGLALLSQGALDLRQQRVRPQAGQVMRLPAGCGYRGRTACRGETLHQICGKKRRIRWRGEHGVIVI